MHAAASLLLVEDDADAMATLEDVLASIAGLELSFRRATCGAEALAELERGGIDVVVADILMPGMTGIDLLERANACGYLQPFLFVTSLRGVDTAVAALRLGAFDFIEKPLAKVKIATPLAKAIAVSRALQTLKAELDQHAADPRSAELRKAAEAIMKLRAVRHQKVA